MRGLDGGAVLVLVVLAVVALVPILGSGAADRSRRRARRGKPLYVRRPLRRSRRHFLGDGTLAGPAAEDPGPSDLDGNGHVGCGTGSCGSGGCGSGGGDW